MSHGSLFAARAFRWKCLRNRFLSVCVLCALLLVACASPPASRPGQPATSDGAPRATDGAPAPAAPKRLVAAISGNAPALNNKLNINSSVQGVDLLETLVSAGMTSLDIHGVRRPQLAERIPSIDDGTWRILPDGKAETTWQIREGAQWHDGTPFTADDLAFTVQVGQDRELAMFGDQAYTYIEGVDIVDPRTAVIHWSRPFIGADGIFSTGLGISPGVPLPKHLLAQAYAENKAGFAQLPFWTTEFVGTGPFKLNEFERDSHVILDAFPGYVLGRPKIDRLEVRFIPDGNTLSANLLSGAVEMTIGRGLSLEQGATIRDRWPDGHMDPVPYNGIFMWPQLLGPTPMVIGDVRFRRAVMHALDRSEMANVMTLGLGTVLDSWVLPSYPEFNDVKDSIVKYAYDPRLASEMIQGLGYTRGADGLFHDARGESIAVEVRTLAADYNQRTTLSVVDAMRRAGIDASIQTIPPQRQTDSEYRSTFPGFQILLGSPNPNLLHSSRAGTPANNFSPNQNYPRYMNPEYDALADRYYSTIPWAERMELLRQILNQVSDQVIVLPLFEYEIPVLIHNRVRNVIPGSTWNAHEWDVT